MVMPPDIYLQRKLSGPVVWNVEYEFSKHIMIYGSVSS